MVASKHSRWQHYFVPVACMRFTLVQLLLHTSCLAVFLYTNSTLHLTQVGEFENLVCGKPFPELGFPFVYVQRVVKPSPPFVDLKFNFLPFPLIANCLFFSGLAVLFELVICRDSKSSKSIADFNE